MLTRKHAVRGYCLSFSKLEQAHLQARKATKSLDETVQRTPYKVECP